MVNSPRTQPITQLSAPAQNIVVLVVSDAENVAKLVESHMRNAGHPVRAAWVTDLEDIEDALQRGTPDILLCGHELDSAPLKDVVSLCARLCRDLPVLLLGDEYSYELISDALGAGARDAVSHEDPQHLKHLEQVLLREYHVHSQLRELHLVRTRLADFESRHKQLLDGTNDAVAHIQEGILSHVNPAFAHLLGFDNPEDLLNLPLMDLVAPEQAPKVKEHLKQLSKGKLDDKLLECSLQKPDGGQVNISARMTRGSVDGENFIEMLIRAEVQAAAAPPLAAAAPPPPSPEPAAPAVVLTSGRMDFVAALHASTQSPQQLNHGALLLAVDDYVGVEERLGFKDADEAVLKLMDWVQQRLKPQDRLFRFSTGELALLVQRPTVGEIEQLASFLCKEVGNQIFATQGHEAQVTLTVTSYPLGGGENAVSVINEIAREARRLSAKGGRQSVVLGATAKSSAVERDEARKAAQVKKAIEENRLKLAYQSIASLEGDTRQHFDVLVRMLDEQGKEQHAGEFIGAAEKFGLMRAIDRWVTLRALKLLSKRDGAQESSSLFIKISEETLKEAETFTAWLAEVLKTRPLKPEELVFQFQETKLQNHIRKAKVMTQGLRSLGASVGIEHFGIGSNSAQLLDHIPASFLKFHQSYTHQFNDKEVHRKMTQLMELAKQRNIKTIVCHVEDANVMARLWQMGVNYIQGYHVQEPEVVLLATDLFNR